MEMVAPEPDILVFIQKSPGFHIGLDTKLQERVDFILKKEKNKKNFMILSKYSGL
jgi:hypothetical protein